MKIIEAQKIYLANRSALVEQKKTLTSQRDKAKKMAELTGDSAYSDEAASLELTLKETEDKFLKNQDILDNLAEQHCNAANAEVNRQISDPETGMAAEYGKILEVARRIATGGKVPYKDEKKLMEYSDKLYQAAKSAAMLLKLREKDRKKYDSLWEDDDKKENPDPDEIADNTEASGDFLEISVDVSTSGGSDSSVGGGVSQSLCKPPN
jgi:hypothetical protein